MTVASDTRNISASVYSERAMKSASSYRRTQMPLITRPQRPARWLDAAWETFSMRSCSTFWRML